MSNFNLDNYVPVNRRLAKFYTDNPEGRVLTSVVEHDREFGFVMVRAELYKTPDAAMPAATGHAFEERAAGYVNKTSYVENAETSAVGRALALLGYEIDRSIASREEMEKVGRYETAAAMTTQNAENGSKAAGLSDLATAKQMGMIRAISRASGIDANEECSAKLNCNLADLSKIAASSFIDHLTRLAKQTNAAVA